MYVNGDEEDVVRVHGDILVSLKDQPETRMSSYHAAENGTHSARFGFSLDVNKVITVLLACDSCLKKLEIEQNDEICANRGSFNMENGDPKLYYKTRQVSKKRS